MVGGVTIKTIAEKAKVNHGTVSRVLNGRTDMSISQETRDRVKRVAKELGYRPNKAARSLTTGKSLRVALWLPAPITTFYAQILQRLEQEANRDGYTAILRHSGDLAADLADLLDSSEVDGIIAVDVLKDIDALPLPPSDTRRPLVLLGVHSSDDADCVVVDLAPAVRAAVSAFVNAGAERIAYFVTQGRMASEWDVRFRTVTAELAAIDRPVEIATLSSGRKETARGEAAEYFRRHGLPDAILCQNDEIAIGVYRALADADARIPGDVSLVGCDGIAEMEYFSPSLSTIAQPIAEMCAAAWQVLQSRMRDLEAPVQRRSLEAVYVPRESVERVSSR